MSVHFLRSSSIVALFAMSLTVACASPSGGSGNFVANGTDATTTTDGSSADTGKTTGTTTGDSSKNTAAVKVKDDSGKTTEVKTDKAATKADATGKTLGASNAGDMLNLFIKDDTGSLLLVVINTKKYPLPMKGIPMGEPASDAYLTLTMGTGIFTSKAGGTIDIDVCPKKEGVAVVGTLNNIVAENAAGVGAKNVTLNGPFNLVYFGGAGALTCKKEDVKTDKKVELGQFSKPTGATCAANPCDGGTNTSRNCCPSVPCISTCWTKCVTSVQTCIQSCGIDGACMQECATSVASCQTKCLTTCEVSSTCNTAMTALNKCQAANQQVCASDDDAKAEACTFDKCCAEMKAAF